MNVVVLQHVPHEHPGLLTRFARESGVALTVIELWKPYNMPSPDGCDALIILGGPMGAYQDYPARDDEVKLIQQAVGKIPILGWCLGSQLLAYALGGAVYPNQRDGRPLKEIGYYEVDFTTDGLADPIFQGLSSPLTVQQWHGDTFDLPAGASLLATAPACKNQAFRAGKDAYGLQFHLEFSPEMIENQLRVDHDWIHTSFDPDEALIDRQAHDYAAVIERSCRTLFNNFLTQA